MKKGDLTMTLVYFVGAGEEIRTLDLHDGNVTLYQLSYTRM